MPHPPFRPDITATVQSVQRWIKSPLFELEQVATAPGRTAFILLTDGVAYRDPVNIGTAIEFAQRADTIL